MDWLFVFCLALSAFTPAPTFAADVTFETRVLHLGKHQIKVEMAETAEQHQQGLMFRQKLDDDRGMLFVFGEQRTLSFWMKNTMIDLDIGYFDESRKLVDIQHMKSAAFEVDPPSYPSKKPAKYALEMASGWFARKQIKVGAVFRLDDGKVTSSRRKSSP